MKKEIYSSAWDSITMSDECFGEILDAIDDVPVITKRPHKKVSYLAIVTAAVVFMCGSIGVAAEAGAFDWIKGFFAEDIVVDKNLSNLVGEMKDFECRSINGTKFSPKGMIYDGEEIYCMLKIDKLPDNKNIKKDYIDVSEFKVNGQSPFELADKSDVILTSCGVDTVTRDSEESGLASDEIALVIGIDSRSDKKLMKDGDRITLELCSYPNKNALDAEDIEIKCAEISFIFRESNYSVLDIDYSKYTCDEIPKRAYDFLFDTVKITPLSVSTKGKGEFYGGELLGDDIKVVFDDGSEAMANGDRRASKVGAYVYPEGDPAHQDIVYSQRYFSKPIDPDRIVKVYLGDMCIYKKQ